MDRQVQPPELGVSRPPPVATAARDLSRREFAKRAGLGTAAAGGLVWAAPKISTVKYLRRAAVGSPPPSTVPPSTPVGQLGGEISLSTSDPCVGGNVQVTASGFAPGTAATIEIDSSSTPIGTTTTDLTGAIDATVKVPAAGPTGSHTLRVVGVRVGGATFVVTAPLNIKTAAECAAPITTEGNPVTPSGATTTTTAHRGSGRSGSHGSLPLTGGNSTDLALMGGAAVLGGRAIYDAAKKRRGGEVDGTET